VDRVSRQAGGASWRDQRAPGASLIFSSSLNDLPEKCTKSEWFCRFFSPCLSCFTQTWRGFQAQKFRAEAPIFYAPDFIKESVNFA